MVLLVDGGQEAISVILQGSKSSANAPVLRFDHPRTW